MKLDKKYFFAVFTVLGFELLVGVNFANALPCEELINAEVEENKQIHAERGLKYDFSVAGYDNYQSFFFTSVNDFWPKLKAYAAERGYDNGKKIDKDAHFIKYWRDQEGYKLEKCYTQALLDANGDIDAIINGSSRNNSSSNKSSSNQSSSSSQTNSAESNAQNSKQSYQVAQSAHDQANAGRGKKRNAKAEVPECIKPNANQTHYKNGCNFAVNISYCFSGDNQSGASIAAKQLLADLNCNNQQFANTELSVGEELAGDYIGLNIAAMVCKSPSQPLDMNFDGREALGRCSF